MASLSSIKKNYYCHFIFFVHPWWWHKWNESLFLFVQNIKCWEVSMIHFRLPQHTQIVIRHFTVQINDSVVKKKKINKSTKIVSFSSISSLSIHWAKRKKKVLFCVPFSELNEFYFMKFTYDTYRKVMCSVNKQSIGIQNREEKEKKSKFHFQIIPLCFISLWRSSRILKRDQTNQFVTRTIDEFT
jgi:hypothetical protein